MVNVGASCFQMDLRSKSVDFVQMPCKTSFVWSVTVFVSVGKIIIQSPNNACVLFYLSLALKKPLYRTECAISKQYNGTVSKFVPQTRLYCLQFPLRKVIT